MYLLATIGFDTAENEPSKVWPASQYPVSPRSPPLRSKDSAGYLRTGRIFGLTCAFPSKSARGGIWKDEELSEEVLAEMEAVRAEADARAAL